MRSFPFWLGRLLGDANAVKEGGIGRRIGRRVTGRWFGTLMRKIFGRAAFRPRARIEAPIDR